LAAILQQAKKDHTMQQRLVLAIQRLKEVIGLKMSLKLLGLSRSLYYEWELRQQWSCQRSATALCVKRHPRQLTSAEVDKIKHLLSDEQWAHWPICSIASLALRQQTVVASLFTWYRSARLLNITHKAVRKPVKQKGLEATNPNQYLHVDTTYYALSNGKRVFITFVMDNYSKMILGFSLSDKLSFT
jgi:hypothetical protein